MALPAPSHRYVTRHGGRHAFADTITITIADCYLLPQVYSAERFGVDLSRFPALQAVAAQAKLLEAFARAHPSH